MSSVDPIREIRDAIDNNDYAKFVKYIEFVPNLDFDFESKIISKKMDKFLIHLINIGKLSQSARLLLGAMIDPKIKKMIKLKEL